MRLNPERAAVEHDELAQGSRPRACAQRRAAEQAGVGLARDRSEAGKQDEVVVVQLVAGGYRPTLTSDARSVAREVDASTDGDDAVLGCWFGLLQGGHLGEGVKLS